jgi:hypothetical protein
MFLPDWPKAFGCTIQTDVKTIDTIVIACFKKDVYLLKTCVASIRYWYPDVSIYLLKDTQKGDFSTAEIEKAFRVSCLSKEGRYSGWGFSKFEAFFLNFDRFLLLDADTVFLGKVLDELSKYDDDFLVTGVDYQDPQNYVVKRDYVQTEKLKAIDPSYVYPGFGVNTGQLVVTTGIVTEKEIDDLLVFKNGRIMEKYPGLFPHADQGVINYLLTKKIQAGFRVRYVPFWLWPGVPEAQEVELNEIKAKAGYPFVLHWAGVKPTDFRKFMRYDILQFYQDYYFSQLKNGAVKKKVDFYKRLTIVQAKNFKHALVRAARR